MPSIISLVSGVLSENGINIENMQSKSKKEYAYTILDITGGDISDAAVSALNAIDGVIRTRVIR